MLDLASAALVDEVVKARQRGLGGSGRDASLAKRTQVLFAFRELLNDRKERDRRAHHRRARQGALRRRSARSPAAWRSPSSPAASRTCSRAASPRTPRPTSTSTRSASRSASSRSSRRSTSRPWCRCGSSRSPSPAATPSCSSPSEKDPSAALAIAALWKEAGLPDGVMQVVNGDKEAVDALLTHPDVKSVSFVGSTPIAQVRLRDRHRARQARPGPRRREEPHARAARRRPRPRRRRRGQRRLRLGGRAVHGDLGARRRRADRRRADRARSRTGWASSSPATAPAAATWARWSRAQHRDKVAVLPRRRGRGRGATLVVDGRGADFDARRRGLLPRADALRQRRARRCRSTTTRSSARCCRSCGSHSYDEGLELINSNPYGNGTAIFTNDGGAARRFQSEVEVGMVGVNVPIPVPVSYYSFGGWKNSPLRRHPRPRHGGRALLHPRQGRHLPLARPEPRRPQPRLPPERLTTRARAPSASDIGGGRVTPGSPFDSDVGVVSTGWRAGAAVRRSPAGAVGGIRLLGQQGQPHVRRAAAAGDDPSAGTR